VPPLLNIYKYIPKGEISMQYSISDRHIHKKSPKEGGFLFGFIASILVIILHTIHFALPILLPALLVLNISTPYFLHHFTIPPVVTIASILWIIGYLFRKRFIFFWSGNRTKR
jgi:hypothetical protein